MIQPTLINLHPNECSQELHYYPFAVNLDRCVGSCNTLNNLSNKACVPNKTEDLNLTVLNMVTGINKPKILTKHVSCECTYKFDSRKCYSNQKWNNDKYQCQCNKHGKCEKDYIVNPASCTGKSFFFEKSSNKIFLKTKRKCYGDETIKFYFSFQKKFIIDRLAITFFFI